MSDARTAPNVQIETKKDLPKNVEVAYYVFNFLNSFSTVMSLGYLTFFVTEWTGVSATLMATVYTVARFADLGVQVFAGNIMQRLNKFRPLLLIVPLISQGGNLISFLNPNIPIGVKLIVLTVGYCMIHFPMNFWTITTFTLLMRIAGPNPENRMAITASNTRAFSAQRIIQPLITLPLILWFIERGLPGYLLVMIIYGIVTFIACGYLYVVTKPYETPEIIERWKAAQASNVKPPSFLEMYKLAAKNRPIVALLISSTINTGIGGQVFAAGTMYYWRYSVGSFALQPVGGSIAGFVALGVALFAPFLAKKMGKKNTWLFNMGLNIIVYLIVMFFADGNPWVFISVVAIQTLGTNLVGVWGIQLWLDAAEVQLYETGIDIRSFTMGLNNYPIKLGFIVSGPFVAIMLNNSGYVESAAGVGTLDDPARFVMIWMIIPLIGMVVSFINLFINYNISEDYAKQCAVANVAAAAERQAAAAAAGGGAAPAAAR